MHIHIIAKPGECTQHITYTYTHDILNSLSGQMVIPVPVNTLCVHHPFLNL